MEKRWVTSGYDTELAGALSKQCQISDLLAGLLVRRGADTPEKIERFLHPDERELSDPFLLPDMAAAKERLEQGLTRGEAIVVYGDYDVDGVTATAALTHYLRSCGAAVTYYIPDRAQEGYGLSREALHKFAGQGIKLIVTVDTGITAAQEVKLARELGIDVIITDHHECPEELPEAAAVVNPKRAGGEYPFLELAGVGVVFQLLCALSGDTGRMLREYADLVAIGTVADVMPLLYENRFLVKTGLERMNREPRLGLRMLLASMGKDKKEPVTSTLIGYHLAPRINAAGRIGCAAEGVELFLSTDEAEACTIAAALCDENQRRKDMENEIMAGARRKIAALGERLADKKVLFLWDEDWHPGVIGIVASRLCEQYHRPTILFAIDAQGMAKGSGRSVEGFNLFEALSGEAEMMERFGGHEQAAGLTLKAGLLQELDERVNRYAEQHQQEALPPSLDIALDVTLPQLSRGLVYEMERLEPFGTGNPVPVFAVRGARISQIVPLSGGKHVKLLLREGDRELAALFFGTTASTFPFAPGDLVDLAGTLEINSFRGRESLQLIGCDMKLNETAEQKEKRARLIYKKWRQGEPLTKEECAAVCPKREDFVALYWYIKHHMDRQILTEDLRPLNRKISSYGRTEMNFATMMLCLSVLDELGLITYSIAQEQITLELFQLKHKINLDNSTILSALKQNGREGT